ncbi:ATP-binding protein [Desulfosediminicola flagellatus]|uniref:ATP-binding protein n=1 Tax=Desulfosediminicola flagellatus TaxID=2569541 RepID=UPI00142ECAD8|nr:ATP-binding protein [Desulfosediminicola flagellatus]
MRNNPIWKTNLAICVIIVALVGGYFFYQVHKASEQFRKNSREHSKVLAAAVELNIRNAILSNDGFEAIITSFLQNSARFIAYLNIIESFSSSELTAFAKETGLAGVTIIPAGNSGRVDGPVNWGPDITCKDLPGLNIHSSEHLYTLIDGVEEGTLNGGCVIVGFSTKDVEAIQKDVSVEHLIASLSKLHGIAGVQLVAADEGAIESDLQLAKLVERDGERFTETRLRMNDQVLIVTQRASHFAKRLRQMYLEFTVFVSILIVLGAVSSWWLFYTEKLRINAAREYEQEMARQHEEAALGRAAATIAHEIRNPLNAIGMGLQRLQLEAEGLDEDHSGLIISMREAVRRSNNIVTSLQQYVRDFEVGTESVDLTALLKNTIALYSPGCEDQGIDIVLSPEDGYIVPGDGHLLGQLFENVIKNAVEAQPHGGYCRVAVKNVGKYCRVTIINGGYTLSSNAIDTIFEPYFTSKTQGTGLGLAISRKIVEAHGGTITAVGDDNEQKLTMTIELPRQSV